MKVRYVTTDEFGHKTWDFGHGYTSYTNKNTGIGQDIDCALNEWKRDCFWALQSGIDWRTRLGQKNQKELLDADIYGVISNRAGVLAVQDFKSNLIDRTYTCQCEVFTIYSDNFTFTFSKEVK